MGAVSLYWLQLYRWSSETSRRWHTVWLYAVCRFGMCSLRYGDARDGIVGRNGGDYGCNRQNILDEYHQIVVE